MSPCSQFASHGYWQCGSDVRRWKNALARDSRTKRPPSKLSDTNEVCRVTWGTFGLPIRDRTYRLPSIFGSQAFESWHPSGVWETSCNDSRHRRELSAIILCCSRWLKAWSIEKTNMNIFIAVAQKPCWSVQHCIYRRFSEQTRENIAICSGPFPPPSPVLSFSERFFLGLGAFFSRNKSCSLGWCEVLVAHVIRRR